MTSTEKKKKKKENKLTHATKNVMIGTLINPNRQKEPFKNQPLNVNGATEIKKSKRVLNQKED